MEIYPIHVSYSGSQNLYKITNLVESVDGVKIQYLRFTNNGTGFTGVMIVETSDTFQFRSVVKLIRSSRACCLL